MYPDPDPDNPIYPLDYNAIAEHQGNDQHLLNLQNNIGDNYQNINFNGISLICFKPQRNTTWKINTPSTLVAPNIHWYHIHLGHFGAHRLLNRVNTHFYAPQLRESIDNLVKQ
jgi:Integrase zinc binding domain